MWKGKLKLTTGHNQLFINIVFSSIFLISHYIIKMVKGKKSTPTVNKVL